MKSDKGNATSSAGNGNNGADALTSSSAALPSSPTSFATAVDGWLSVAHKKRGGCLASGNKKSTALVMPLLRRHPPASRETIDASFPVRLALFFFFSFSCLLAKFFALTRCMYQQANAPVRIKKEKHSSDDDCVIVERPVAAVKVERPATPSLLAPCMSSSSSRRVPPVERRSFFQAVLPSSATVMPSSSPLGSVASSSPLSSAVQSPSSPVPQRSPTIMLQKSVARPSSSPPAVASSALRVLRANDSCLYEPRGALFFSITPSLFVSCDV